MPEVVGAMAAQFLGEAGLVTPAQGVPVRD